MPSLPKYRKHRSGNARVTLGGKDHYLGPYGSPESKREYQRLCAEWVANGFRLPDEEGPMLVTELCTAYFTDAKQRLAPSSLDPIKWTLKVWKSVYGGTPAADMTPLTMRALQVKMAELGNSRTTINERIRRIITVLKWGESRLFVPKGTHEHCRTVASLRRGGGGKERPKRRPVSDDDVAKTVAAAPSPIVRDMIMVQKYTGMRSGELVAMRWCEISTKAKKGGVWHYRPQAHKTEHHGHDRTIYLGPKTQAILMKYRDRPKDAPIFSPNRSETLRRAEMRQNRKTKVQPSQVARAAKSAKRQKKKEPGEGYTVESYRRAVTYACKKAGINAWHPHQLRHASATRVREEFGIDSAQKFVGHRTLDMTNHYATLADALGDQVALAVG